MGAFEDYVNANLGIRKPLITDAGLPSQSAKAAGIIGSQYIDSNTYFLYEKTGEDNSLDWVKIADLGQSRGGEPGGEDGSVQFNSGNSFGGSDSLTYNYQSSLLSGESGRFSYIHSDFVTGQTGNFEEELIVGNPNEPTSEDVFVVDDGNITAAGSAEFTGPLKAPTGYFNEIIVSGDAYISGDFYVSGTTYVNEVVDTTISGTLSGYTGIFDMTSGANASFTNSLTISGVPVSTGAGGTVGGLPVVGGDNDNIDFGGTEPGDNREINFQQGGENVMVIDQAGDINIENDLYVSGNISGDIISGKTGVFTESLTISGVPVSTGSNSSRNYPVLTGVEFNTSTNILSFFRDLGASNIDIDLSSLNGGGGGSFYQSNLWWEESNGDLILLNEETTTSHPATQLFEESQSNSYSPRESVFSSSTEAAQFFEEINGNVTLKESPSLPPINNSSAVSTQWFEDIGSDQLAMRESSIDTSNPAVQLWESAGSDKYTPRSEPYSSNSESAQYFEELGSHITTIDSPLDPNNLIVTAPFGGDASAVDQEDGTFLVTNSTQGQAFVVVKYDFGSSYAINGFNIKQFRFNNTSNSNFVFEGSNDDSNWNQLGSTMGNSSALTNYPQSVTASFRYYRLRVYSFGTNGQAELDFIEFT